MAQVHDLNDAFQYIQNIVDDLHQEGKEFDAEATALQKRVDELEDEVADLRAQIKAWEDA